MRMLFALLLLGGAGLAGWYMFAQMTADDGELIGIAFGQAHEGEVEMHSIISSYLIGLEPPRIDERGKRLWQEWVDEHFAMLDAEGAAVPLRYRSTTDIIPHLDLRGIQQGFVVAHLTQGMEYSMTYRPVIAGPDRYNYKFTAPTEDVSLQRKIFAPVVE